MDNKRKIPFLDKHAVSQIQHLASDSAYGFISKSFRLKYAIFTIAFFAAGILFANSFGLVMIGLAILNYSLLNFYRLQMVFTKDKIKDVPEPAIDKNRKEFPLVTILVPLKQENEVIHQTFSAISNLNYPSSSIQGIIIVESTDTLTKKSIETSIIPDGFEVMEIPTLPPFTKGRAIQRALLVAKGKYITIYDAESRPEPNQVIKAVEILEKEKGKTCLQSIIRIENAKENEITSFFASEFWDWYDKRMVNLHKRGIPFGLGGNSFFLATETLKEVGGWDPFNVTEDAELTVRLIKNNVDIKLMNSITHEACPSTMKNWIKQRTRWSKGLLTTSIIHLISGKFGFKGFTFKQWYHFWLRMYVGNLIPFFFAFIFILFLFQSFSYENFVLVNIVLAINLVPSLIVSMWADKKNFNTMGIKIRIHNLFAVTLIYWGMYLWAGFRANYEFLFSPLKWHKTDHSNASPREKTIEGKRSEVNYLAS